VLLRTARTSPAAATIDASCSDFRAVALQSEPARSRRRPGLVTRRDEIPSPASKRDAVSRDGSQR
jgi:hypothetical protein